MTTGRSRGGAFPVRQGSPPSPEFFEAPRPAAGTAAFGLTLDGLRIEIEGLSAELAHALRERYGAFADDGAPAAGETLRAKLGLEDRDYFIDPPARPEFNPVFLDCDGERVRYLGYKVAGWFDTRGGEGSILLARGTYEPDLRALENWIRAAVAWRAVDRGGALVHAASAVWRGRGYLFFGASGAGKSTLAEVNRRGTIVSDDLSLVLPRADGGVDLVGSPFRGTWERGEPVTGRFPLAAAFRLVQAREARVERVARIVAFGQLVGNLTFVAEAFDKRPDLFASVERVFSRVPLAHLHFRRDDSYWDAIEAAGL